MTRDKVVQQWIQNTVQKKTPTHLSKIPNEILTCLFTRGSERRCDCDRSDTAPVTFSIYRQQKGTNPLTAGPGPRENLLYLKAECGHRKVLTGPFLFVLSCILIGSPKSDMSPAILFFQ